MNKKKIKRSGSIESIKRRRSIRFWFIMITVLLLSSTAILTALIFVGLSLIPFTKSVADAPLYILIPAIMLSCIIIGSAMSAITSKFILSRLRKIQDGMQQISKGNFSVRVAENDRMGKMTEFGELETTFNKMASDLDGIELFRNDFINNFSHEFKTPIVSIKGFARQLQSDRLTEEQRREYIDIIASESERLANMSTNILLLTKLENQQLVSERTCFSLDEQIRGAIILLESLWSKKNIEFDLDGVDEISFEFNEEMLSHVWINIISNAIKFSHNNSCIHITLTETDDVIECTIRDEGIGMSEETQSRIFEKFYQGDDSHHSLGNGIGLNIVHRIVTLASGEISVHSVLGEGSTFTVRLPK